MVGEDARARRPRQPVAVRAIAQPALYRAGVFVRLSARKTVLAGYGVDPVEVLRPTWADEAGDLVAVRRIPFVSVCEHHLLPFFGHADVCYLPAGQLTGLSRIEELVHCLSRRLQMQERLGREIARALREATEARGVACVLRAQHLCVFARGQRRQGTITETVALLGDLEDDPGLRERFARWLGTAAAAEAES